MHRAKKAHAAGDAKALIARRGDRLGFERKPTEYAGWIWCTAEGSAKGAPPDAGWVPEAWVSIEGGTCVLLRDYDATELPLEVGEEVALISRESGWAWVRNRRGREGWVPIECLEEVSAGGRAPGHSERSCRRDRRYYGRIYHILFDRKLDAGRSAGASVLDVASGTGDLALALRREKNCRVVGIDLSPRMLEFAAKHNPYDDVSFAWQDATDLKDFSSGAFECATMTLLLHELPREARAQAVSEALRVARKVIVADCIAPLPKDPDGLSVRLIEWVGRHHYHDFRDYLARGGLDGVLDDVKRAKSGVEVGHREVPKGTCREILILSHHPHA
jgi:SAM-dependent methyltransferase